MTAPRPIIVPVIAGVWVLLALTAAYTCAMFPQFAQYSDYYQSGGAIQPAGIATAFVRFHLVGVPLGLAILGYGLRLLLRAETSAAHLAWYASLSVSLVAVWQLWAWLAERSINVLSLPA